MVRLENFYNYPGIFADRLKKLHNVDILFFSAEKMDDYDEQTNTGWVHLQAIANRKYNIDLLIKIENNNFNLKSPAKANCSCPSFEYEFAWILYHRDGLAFPTMYWYQFNVMYPSPPKKRNKHHVIAGCKHIVKFAHVIHPRYLGNGNFRLDVVTDPRLQIQVEIAMLNRQVIKMYGRNPSEAMRLQRKIQSLYAKIAY